MNDAGHIGIAELDASVSAKSGHVEAFSQCKGFLHKELRHCMKWGCLGGMPPTRCEIFEENPTLSKAQPYLLLRFDKHVYLIETTYFSYFNHCVSHGISVDLMFLARQET